MSDKFPRPSGDAITDRKRQRKAEAERQAHSPAPPGSPAQTREITCPHCKAKIVDSGKRDEITQDWLAVCGCGWWRSIVLPIDPEANAPENKQISD